MVDLTDASIPNEDKLAFAFFSFIKGCCFWKWPDGNENPPKSKDITVLIPCYGKADTVEQTVKSALDQTMKPFQVIVLLMDEKSVAKSEDLSKLDKKVKLIESERLNVCAARNKLAELCPTEYFVFLDADDELASNFLEECYKAEASLVFPAQVFTQEAFERDEIKEGDVNFKLKDKNGNIFINQNFTCLFHKTAFKELGGFNEKYKNGFEDTNLMLSLLVQQKYKISSITTTKSFYKENPNGLTKSKDFFDIMLIAFNDWLPTLKKAYESKQFGLAEPMASFFKKLNKTVTKDDLHQFYNDLAKCEINNLEGYDIPCVIFGELQKRSEYPVSISFTFNLTCNKKCGYCGQLELRKKCKPLPDDELFRNFDKGLTKFEKLLGYRPRVQILGGEPTLWSDNLIKKIQKRLEKYSEYLVFSNGYNKESLFWKDPKAIIDYHVTDWTECKKIEGVPSNAYLKIVVTKKDIDLLDKFLEVNQDIKCGIVLAFCHGGKEEWDLGIDGIKRLAELEWKWRKIFPLANRVNLNYYETYRDRGLKYMQEGCKKYKKVWSYSCADNTVSPCCMFKKSFSLEEFNGQEIDDCGDCLFFF